MTQDWETEKYPGPADIFSYCVEQTTGLTGTPTGLTAEGNVAFGGKPEAWYGLTSFVKPGSSSAEAYPDTAPANGKYTALGTVNAVRDIGSYGCRFNGLRLKWVKNTVAAGVFDFHLIFKPSK
jgi:hypothetical protein